MKTTIFRKVRVSDRLPNPSLSPIEYHTNNGRMYGEYIDKSTCIYWLEPVELPSEEELRKESLGKFSEAEAKDEEIGDYIEEDAATFMKGANYILNHINSKIK